MKFSIRSQFAGVFCILMVGTILLCWFMNTTLLERYYINRKENVLISTYNKMNQAAGEGSLVTDEFNVELQKISARYNLNYIILNAEAEVLRIREEERLTVQLLNYIFGRYDNNTYTILEEHENYILWVITDNFTNTDYIEMWGAFEDGSFFLLRSALESIKDSVAISNRFLGYIGIIAVIVSAFVALFVSKKITDPIKELTEISERMIDLDFEVKYEGNNKTEIALLGQNINNLSKTLEMTISELKGANQELRKDIEKKEEIDEMRKEFLSNVSHELKTPIALIQGYAEGLKEIISDEENRDFYCDVIADEAAKMNELVKKLLTLNQLEFGHNVVSVERFNIVDFIRTYIQSMDILVKQKEISVRMQPVEDIYVWADEFKVEEVFSNYFSNAMNHVSEGGIIDVKLTRIENRVRISVFNMGYSIPEESIEHIWEKFYKVDKARTRQYGGSGVGLSIVKAIMESMNQQYGVINYEDGVEFWFELDAGY